MNIKYLSNNKVYLPIDKAIICFSGCGSKFILSTIERIGLKVFLANSDAFTIHGDDDVNEPADTFVWVIAPLVALLDFPRC